MKKQGLRGECRNCIYESVEDCEYEEGKERGSTKLTRIVTEKGRGIFRNNENETGIDDPGRKVYRDSERTSTAEERRMAETGGNVVQRDRSGRRRDVNDQGGASCFNQLTVHDVW